MYKRQGLRRKQPAGDDYLLVDGYNIVNAWKSLLELAAKSLDAAREQLIHRLANYQGWKKCRVIVVFDAYKVKGGVGSVEHKGDLWVVYTKEAETADMYIEKTTYELGRDHRVRVATSDGLEQLIILGRGAQRMPCLLYTSFAERTRPHDADGQSAHGAAHKAEGRYGDERNQKIGGDAQQAACRHEAVKGNRVAAFAVECAGEAHADGERHRPGQVADGFAHTEALLREGGCLLYTSRCV